MRVLDVPFFLVRAHGPESKKDEPRSGAGTSQQPVEEASRIGGCSMCSFFLVRAQGPESKKNEPRSGAGTSEKLYANYVSIGFYDYGQAN